MFSFLNWFSSNPTPTPISATGEDIKEESVILVKPYELIRNIVSLEQAFQLPTLPFCYSDAKCGIFISRHSDWPYATIITDLDHKLIQYLKEMSETKIPLYYNRTPFHEIIAQSSYSDNRHHLDGFCDITGCNNELYYGAIGKDQQIMDVINWLEGDNGADFESLCQVVANANTHFDTLYGGRDKLFFE